MINIVPSRLREEVKVITQGKESNLNRLREILNSLGRSSWDMSIQVLKEELRQGSRGQVSYIALEKAYSDKDYTGLMALLEERFLDEISDLDIDIMYKYIKNKDKLKELYLSANNNNRFIASVISL